MTRSDAGLGSADSACGEGQLACDGGCVSSTDIHIRAGSVLRRLHAASERQYRRTRLRQRSRSYACHANYADCEDAGTGCMSLASSPNCGACGASCTAGTSCSDNDAGTYACAIQCGARPN